MKARARVKHPFDRIGTKALRSPYSAPMQIQPPVLLYHAPSRGTNEESLITRRQEPGKKAPSRSAVRSACCVSYTLDSGKKPMSPEKTPHARREIGTPGWARSAPFEDRRGGW